MSAKTISGAVGRAILLAACVLVLACQSDGPEFASGETIFIQGVLEADELTQTDLFVITRAGTVNVLATRITARDAISGEPIEDPALGVTVGRPDPENDTICQATISQLLVEGDSFSVFFEAGLRCLTAVRAGGLQENTIVEYDLTLAPAFS